MDKLILNTDMIQINERRSGDAPYHIEFQKRDVLIKQGESDIILEELEKEYTTLDSSNVINSIDKMKKNSLWLKVFRVLIVAVLLSVSIFTMLVIKYVGGV